MTKQKPYQNKLLKHPRKRIKKRIKQKVKKKFAGKKDLPMLMHGMNLADDPKRRLSIKPEILQRFESLLDKEKEESLSNSSESDNISYLSNKLKRLSIIDFIRSVRMLGNYIPFFEKCCIKSKGKPRPPCMKIHGFASFCSAFLDIEIEEKNINSLFLTIDKDKNGYIDQDEFINIIENIKPDGKLRRKTCARLVIDQMYQELVSSDNLTIKLLHRSLDNQGYIKVSELILFLSRYNIELTDEEIDLIYEANGKLSFHKERMICFQKLIEDCVTRSNVIISFKINVPRRSSLKSKDFKDVSLINTSSSDDNDLETSYYSSEERDKIVEEAEETPLKEEPLDILNRMRKAPKFNFVSQLLRSASNSIPDSPDKIVQGSSSPPLQPDSPKFTFQDPKKRPAIELVIKAKKLLTSKLIKGRNKKASGINTRNAQIGGLPSEPATPYSASGNLKMTRNSSARGIVQENFNGKSDSSKVIFSQHKPRLSPEEISPSTSSLEAQLEKAKKSLLNKLQKSQVKKSKSKLSLELANKHRQMLVKYLQNQEELNKILDKGKKREKIRNQIEDLERLRKLEFPESPDSPSPLLEQKEIKLEEMQEEVKGIPPVPVQEQPEIKNKEPLLNYLNCKESEKERIVSCFLKVFEQIKAYNISKNNGESKSITLPQFIKLINMIFPSLMEFSGRKVRSVLKFHIDYPHSSSNIDQEKLEEFIEREKEIIKARKYIQKEKCKQQKPLFYELLVNAHKKQQPQKPKSPTPKFEIFKSITKPLGKYQNHANKKFSQSRSQKSNIQYTSNTKFQHIYKINSPCQGSKHLKSCTKAGIGALKHPVKSSQRILSFRT